MATKEKTSKITVKIIDKSGKTNDIDITSFFKDKEVTRANINFVHQMLHSYLNNQRQATAKSKTRGEIRGGGRKPWRQKGTGRARHGTIRSPLWRTGGAVFGPTGKQNFSQGFSKKMKKKVMRLALLDCLQKNCLIVLDEIDKTIDSTKKMRIFLTSLPIKYNNLVIFEPELLSLTSFTDNLDIVQTKTDQIVNALDIYQAQTVVLSRKSLENILSRIGVSTNPKDSRETVIKNEPATAKEGK